MKRGAHFQQTLAFQASFERHARKSKRELFLDQMNEVVPWSELLALVEPHYPKAGNGRRGIEVPSRQHHSIYVQLATVLKCQHGSCAVESAVVHRTTHLLYLWLLRQEQLNIATEDGPWGERCRGRLRVGMTSHLSAGSVRVHQATR